jgi:DNA-binding transcriptional regulator YdaS (Cro superfamily)
MDTEISIPDIIAKLGGQSAAATKVGAKRSAVSMWVKRGAIPARYCQAVSAASGVPLHALRPDIFPAPECEPTA